MPTRMPRPNPGRVTMRRLNRVEYCNTIRDLVGVNFDPTEDFPSDDIGHGFDNIGDVLEYYGHPTVDRIVKALSVGDDKLSVLVTEIVMSDAFRQRPG